MVIPKRRRIILEEGVYRLPFGELSVHIDPDEFRYGPFRMVNFADTAELEVRGLDSPPHAVSVDGRPVDAWDWQATGLRLLLAVTTGQTVVELSR